MPVTRYWTKLRMGVSDFRISVQSLIKENCRNSRISDDIDIKLGPVPKLEGRVAWWLATCAWKPKVPGSSPAASYAQR